MSHKISLKFANLLPALVISFAGLGSALAAAGSLDPTFGTDGKVTTDFSSALDQGNAIAIQPDGKIVVAGQSYSGSDFDFALTRYNSDGSLDMTFDNDGKVTTDRYKQQILD